MASDRFPPDGWSITRRDRVAHAMIQAVAGHPSGMVVADASGVVDYVNDRFTVLTGLLPEDIPDLDAFAHAFTIAGAEPFRGMWGRIAGGDPWRAEFPALHRDGHHYWVAVEVTPAIGSDGGIAAIVATVQDVTERLRMEEHIRRVQKMQAVGVLAGGIAHDFNNILTVILGHAHLAHDSLPPDSEARDDLAQVLTAADRAKGLVNQLLTFARKERVAREEADLGALVESALQLVAPTIPHDVSVRFDRGGDPLPVLVAPAQIQQVVVNLCRNAVDAIADREGGPGNIVVTLSQATADAVRSVMGTRALPPPGRFVELCVSDTGCGMDKATLARIFEPFFTTKPVDRGTGLGLAAVHGIVAEHGGAIDVVSHPGGGSRFTVFLPLAGRGPTRGREAAAGRGGRVLVVDEARALGGVTAQLLRSLAVRVVTAVLPRRALALHAIAPDRFDLVVLVQPEAGAAWKLLTLARAFAASSSGVPILACAHPDVELEGAASAAAGIGWIVRMPFSASSFVALVGQILDERASRDTQ
ncbi:PAS domain S-box protein [Azospirillum sp. RWY-5-1]|uniref:histidine kinase n=1 Tax=Azospirillum oleiclasticum TaxID=2735135 RepID=A0ABX2T1E5_9PROT|nr:ATP-binding protein [Azospirillum oleiclasticum]NYZ10969.1 PAS domain S-box protein [Azospirillum oleiclasticum]NYZ18131.1 PAS domain S-box protein [Azospirillum oleiclasticum]